MSFSKMCHASDGVDFRLVILCGFVSWVPFFCSGDSSQAQAVVRLRAGEKKVHGHKESAPLVFGIVFIVVLAVSENK